MSSRDPSTLIGKSREPNTSVCRAGFSIFNITPNGEITACPAFNILYGSIKQGTLSHIISSSKVLKRWRNATYDQFEECGKFEYCPFCNLCPGNNFIEHHSYLKPGENNCFFAKVRYSLVRDVKEKGKETLSPEELDKAITALPVYKPKRLHRIIKSNNGTASISAE